MIAAFIPLEMEYLIRSDDDGAPTMSNNSTFDIDDTKQDVFGVGISGSGNYIVKGPVIQIVSPSKEAIEELRKLMSAPPTISEPSSSTVDVFSNLRKANESYDKGDYNEALRCLEVILKDRNFIRTLYNTGLVLISLHKDTEAIQWFERVLAVEPNNVKALFGEATVFGIQGRHEEAVQCLDRVLAVEPNNVKALSMAGMSLSFLAKHDEARKYMQKALAIDPNDIRLWGINGFILGIAGKYEDSIQWFERVLAVEPNNVLILFQKGLDLFFLQRYDEAIKCHDKALAIDPNNVSALRFKGSALISLKKFEEALQWMDKVLAIEPNNVDILIGIEGINKKSFVGNLLPRIFNELAVPHFCGCCSSFLPKRGMHLTIVINEIIYLRNSGQHFYSKSRSFSSFFVKGATFLLLIKFLDFNHFF